MPPAGPPAGGSGMSIGNAFSWAMARLGQHFGMWVALVAIVVVLRIIDGVIEKALTNNAANATTSSGVFANIGVTLIFAVIFGALIWLVQVGVLRAAVRRTQGVQPSMSMLTTGENLGAYIVVAILYGIAFTVGLALCILPGLIVAFLFQFAPVFAVDKGQSVGDAFRNSYQMVTKNFGTVVLVAVVNIVAGFIGGSTILWGLLSIVTVPFSLLFTAYAYRSLQGEPVAD